MTVVHPAPRSPRTFGVEEEVALLEPASLDPVDVAEEVLAEVERGVEGRVSHEFLRSQLELSTPVLVDAPTADRVLRRWRSAVGAAAERRGLVAASVGTPIGRERSRVSDGDRYARFDELLGAARPDHRIQGLHVHVAVRSRDEGVAVLRAMRPWLAPLLALSANSPCFDGRDTGFASWRTIVGRRFTTASVPPDFADAADYERRVRAIVGLGATIDEHSLFWMARLPEHYPTVELRVFDAQLRADETVALALLSRALVETAAAGELPHAAAARQPELLDAAVWHAARHGTEADLVDPASASAAPAWVVIERMLGAARPALEATRDWERVAAFAARVRAEGWLFYTSDAADDP
ncbi:YbdK family carboxylate-amine ligase, partial [Agrococcus sp. HG114]